MSNAQIEVQPAHLREMASQIRTCRNDMESCLQEAASEMQNLSANGWRSPAGEEIRSRFDRLRNKYFANYPAAMDTYETFLRNTADEYEAADDRRKAEINAMLNMGVR